jgi:hypothetical protein
MTIPTTSLIASAASVLLASTVTVQAGQPGGYPDTHLQTPNSGAYNVHPGAPVPQGNSAAPPSGYGLASDDDDDEDGGFDIEDDEDEGDENGGLGLSLER